MPCVDSQLGYFDNSTGCYYGLDTTFQPPPTDTVDQHPPGTGNWYDVSCPGVRGTAGGIVWFARPPAGPPALPSPAVLAASAQRMLAVPAPAIASSPGPNEQQLVGLPVWLWLDRSSAGPQSATASASNANGSVSVTATARITRVVWDMGDGTTVVCRGAGTPYARSDDPKSASRDCGHTYERSSADAPGGRFPVTVTAYWQVSWSGAGQGGTLPAISRTTRTSFAVAESQAINN